MKKQNAKKKTMSLDEVEELSDAENLLVVYREDLATYRDNVREAKRDTREALANLKKEEIKLASAEKDVAEAKKGLDRLKAKYKGWARPNAKTPGTGNGSFDQVAEGMP
jgi:hypothetical protein